MKAISLKLPEDLEKASRRCAGSLRLSRAAYIRLAVESMNREVRTQARAQRLADVSTKVSSESMRVNREFSVIERDPDA